MHSESELRQQPSEDGAFIQTAFKLRWRVKEGNVLLFKRHIRELKQFEFTPALIAWLHERLEWAIANMLTPDTNAVLQLNVDPAAEIKLSLEEVEPLAAYSLDDIVYEDEHARGLVLSEGVWPATVWLVCEDDTLVACADELFLAVDTLAEQLAQTQGMRVVVEAQNQQTLTAAKAVFALSNEFGFIPIAGGSMPSDTLAENFARLF